MRLLHSIISLRLQPHTNKRCNLAIFDRPGFPQRLIQAAGPGRPTKTGLCPADADSSCRHPLPRASRISLFFGLASTLFRFVKDLHQRHMANSFVLKSLKSEHVGANEQRICHPFFKMERHFTLIIKYLSSCHGREGYSLLLITFTLPSSRKISVKLLVYVSFLSTCPEPVQYLRETPSSLYQI